MKIEVGQTWRTRGGEIVTVDEFEPGDEFPYLLSSGVTVKKNGWEWNTNASANDLIELQTDSKPAADPVNNPAHYTSSPSGVEVIQITEHMNFCLGNAVKYIMRCDLKGKPIEDLRKSVWYLQREIARREKKDAL